MRCVTGYMSEVEEKDQEAKEMSDDRKKGYERGLEMIEEDPEAFEYLAER